MVSIHAQNQKSVDPGLFILIFHLFCFFTSLFLGTTLHASALGASNLALASYHTICTCACPRGFRSQSRGTEYIDLELILNLPPGEATQASSSARTIQNYGYNGDWPNATP